MSPRFWQNQFSNLIVGTILTGLCLTTTVFAQTPTTVPVPSKTSYPGIIETFEKLIQFDQTRFTKKVELLNKNRQIGLENAAPDSPMDLDIDFINSLILHSDPGYLRLASGKTCQFYDTLINDLLRTAEGRVNNMLVNYTTKKGEASQALVSKKDFINKVVAKACPETPKIIEEFQLKNIDAVMRPAFFETPTAETCYAVHSEWVANPRTPYYCKIHEFLKEARNNQGNPNDLSQRKTLAQALEKKISITTLDYIENLCMNVDDSESFCEEFVNVSFWTKIAYMREKHIYAKDICAHLYNNPEPSDIQIKQCLSRMKKEPEVCMYPPGKNMGLQPAPQCDTLSIALNHSSMRADYQDGPAYSDQQGVTNLGRVLLHINGQKIENPNGPYSSISSSTVYAFNKQFNNDENWKLEACYEDKMVEKERCYKTVFGNFGAESYNNVVANILRETRGADMSIKCQMLDSAEYNPLMLQYKSGCYIIYERNQCFISQCKHKILFNDRKIDFIKLKGSVTMDYFPSSVNDERFSQQYLLTKDFRREGRSLMNLTAVNAFFKKNRKGIIHGIGCAEEVLPTFFRVRRMNQCTPLPFIVDGLIRNETKTSFVVRTAIDSLQAPRVINWSYIYSGVRTYQRLHPLRIWTLYGLD